MPVNSILGKLFSGKGNVFCFFVRIVRIINLKLVNVFICRKKKNLFIHQWLATDKHSSSHWGIVVTNSENRKKKLIFIFHRKDGGWDSCEGGGGVQYCIILQDVIMFPYSAQLNSKVVLFLRKIPHNEGVSSILWTEQMSCLFECVFHVDETFST